MEPKICQLFPYLYLFFLIYINLVFSIDAAFTFFSVADIQKVRRRTDVNDIVRKITIHIH